MSAAEAEPRACAPGHTIEVRRPRLDLGDELPKYWMRGQPFATHFLNALSSVFPDGEAYFVKSVLRYKEEIDDPELRKAVLAFAAQEGNHSHQHDVHVQMLLDQGYTGLETRNALVRKMTVWSVKRMPRASLAGTVALEHLTAILARQLLEHPERWTDGMDPRMAPLWRWHALEEAEHKAVAFDVLRKVAPGYGLRAFSLVANTLGLLLDAMDRTVYMLWKDGLLFDRKVWREGLAFLVGRDGLLRGVGPDFLAWFRPGFHPDDLDDTALLERERPIIEAQVA